MSIIMKTNATDDDVKAVVKMLEGFGLRADISKGEYHTVIGEIGDEKKMDAELIKTLQGVKDVIPIQVQYRLMSRSYIDNDITVKVGNTKIGGKEPPVYIAGPCSIESYEQLSRIGIKVKEAGANMLRGGAFKPRTSVHSFQGLGTEGLKHLRRVGEELDMPTVTEVRSELDVEIVAEYADMLQIGARNMYNQDLIEAVAKQNKPVLFKRGFSAQIDEYLSFGERLIAHGNRNVVLCERGITPLGGAFKQQTRYTLDIAAVPVINSETPFPVITDPSHASGRKDLVVPMARASIAAGANGLIIEVHDRPQEALSDANQALHPDVLKELIKSCNDIYETLNRKIG